jgi:membrane AbrB-like protein
VRFSSVAILLAASIGGLVLQYLEVPLGALLGAIFGAAIATLILGGRPLHLALRCTGQVIAGIAIGLNFVPEAVAQMVSYSGLILAAAVISVGSGIAMMVLVARLGEVDRSTAFFASTPGGVAEMSVLAERYGGDSVLVGLAQTLRVLLVVFLVPLGLTLMGWQGTEIADAAPAPFAPLALALMAAGAVLASLALARLHIPNAWLLGGLVVGIVVAYSGLAEVSVPGTAFTLSQILIGASLGARFQRDRLLSAGRFVLASIVGTLLVIVIMSLFAMLLNSWTTIDFPTLVLALAPGGIAEMSITAKSLGLGVVTVTCFHLVRIVFVLLMTVPIYRLVSKVTGHTPSA